MEELLEKRPDLKVKAEFYNNYSVTLIKNGLYDQSKSCIDKAFGLLATREDNKEVSILYLTLYVRLWSIF